jgi:N-methylhydantoinase A
VTDADLVLGRIDPDAFAGGSIVLDRPPAKAAIDASIGEPLALQTDLAALAISEVVDENMASAARVHAVEHGKRTDDRTLVAFGGAAPLHAARVAQKLGVRRIVVPTGAGVGSAVGMLSAPVAYEVARTLYQRVKDLDWALVNGQLEAMRQEAYAVVEASADAGPLVETRTAHMRYVGQGHEITVALEPRALTIADRETLQESFAQEYRRQHGRIIPGLEAEVLTWSITLSTQVDPPPHRPAPARQPDPVPSGARRVFDPASGAVLEAAVYRRPALAPGAHLAGPALIVEDETSTMVSPQFHASVDAHGYLVLEIDSGD